jgi:hypothetical protein
MTLRAALIAMLLLVAAPAAAFACAVCGMGGPGNNAGAYFGMTMALSGLPLLMIGGVVYWVYRRSTAAEASEEGHRPR